jgi:glycosyltransferase involved in cell wall biosynthesis
MNFFPKSIINKSLVIPNVSSEKITLKRDKKPTYKIVSVGALTKNKDFETLILGFHEFNKIDRKYTLHVYGEGPEFKNLRKLIISLGAQDYIKLMGLVLNARKYLKKYDLFIFSSKSEGIPNVVIEAMEQGITVITTKTISGGTELLIKDRESGLLFEIGDFGRLAVLINEVVSNYAFAKYLAQNAQKSLKRFSPDVIMSQWIEAFDKLTSS